MPSVSTSPLAAARYSIRPTTGRKCGNLTVGQMPADLPVGVRAELQVTIEGQHELAVEGGLGPVLVGEPRLGRAGIGDGGGGLG